MQSIELLALLVLLVIPPSLTLCEPFRNERTYVDLTYTFDNTTLGWVQDKPFQLTITQKGITEEGYWLQSDDITTSVHQGTHVDAPCHTSEGRWTLDEIPFSRFVAPAAVVDISDRAARDPDALLEIRDLQKWERETGRSLDRTVVLMRTGWGQRWPDKKTYLGTEDGDVEKLHFPGISVAAAQWLVQKRQIYGIGVDTVSLDNGLQKAGVPAHAILQGANIYGLENLANLEKLPTVGAKIFIFPMKLGGGACGGPARVVADISRGRRSRT